MERKIQQDFPKVSENRNFSPILIVYKVFSPRDIFALHHLQMLSPRLEFAQKKYVFKER